MSTIMNVGAMTLEGFFLMDYERMRNRIAELEAEVARLSSDGYGCIDQHQTCDAVRVEVQSAYTIREFVRNGMSLDQLRKAHAMANDDLFEWATKSYRYSSYGSMTKPIELEYHKFQYTLLVNETRGSHVFVTDGKDRSELIEIDIMEDDMVDNLNAWCRAEHLEKLKLAALSELRDRLGSAISDIERKQSEG